MLAVQEYLEKYSRIREDIALFVTTSKNKEGININDDDIRHVYIESHSMTDIGQMAGRLRHGAENVYIILDSQGHPPSEARFDAFFAEHVCQHKLEEENQPPKELHLLDDMLQQIRRRAAEKAQVCSPAVSPCAFVDELPEVKEFIDYVLGKSPYLRYDYFTGTFKTDVYRELGNKHMNEELAAFREAKADPDKLVQ